MRLPLQVPGPAIQRVVEHQALLQELLVVGDVISQPGRNGPQAGGLLRQRVVVGIGPAHDGRQQGGVGQRVFLRK